MARLKARQASDDVFADEIDRLRALSKIPLHSLRHSYATLAISSGANPRIVSARLGHSTVALTLDIYSHVLPQADAEAANQIAAVLEGE